MAQRYLLIDDTTGKRAAGVAAGSSIWTDTDFTVGVGGQTAFVSSAFASGSKIDVYRNGALVREGSGNDWQRNAGTSTITFNYTVLQNAWVKVRVWN